MYLKAGKNHLNTLSSFWIASYYVINSIYSLQMVYNRSDVMCNLNLEHAISKSTGFLEFIFKNVFHSLRIVVRPAMSEANRPCSLSMKESNSDEHKTVD